jgi:hypothetical protein
LPAAPPLALFVLDEFEHAPYTPQTQKAAAKSAARSYRLWKILFITSPQRDSRMPQVGSCRWATDRRSVVEVYQGRKFP